MSGYPYGGNPPQYPPPQNQIYPQIYNPANAPPPGQPGHQAMGYPSAGQPYPPGLSFPYPGQPGQPGQPGHPSQHPAAMSYPGMPATAPTPTPAYGYQPYAPSQPAPIVEWVPTTPQNAHALTDRAIVAGYEGHDNSPLWVIRARHEGDVIPGKLAIKHNSAYVPWGGKENSVYNIEVCCARPDRVRWCAASNGNVPPNALPAGNTASGEVLYVGRAREQGSLTPGKIHPSHQTMYISFAGQEVPHKTYEVLCTV